MRIEFIDSSEGLSPSSVEEPIKILLLRCMEEMSLPTDAIHKIVISGDTASDFAAALNSLESEVGRVLSFTDSKVHTAVAKVIPFEKHGAVQNIVVLSNWVIAGAIEALRSGTDPNIWPDNWQLCNYIIHHEFGHCRDYSLRGVIGLTRPVFEQFRIEKLAMSYTDILLGEFAATLHSAAFVTRRLQDKEITGFCGDVADILEQIKQSKEAYKFGRQDLRTLADAVSHGFWVCLVQYSKLFGSVVRNGALRPPIESYMATKRKQIFRELEEELTQLENVYPNWSAKLIQPRLHKIWDQLCRSHDFRFEITRTQDALWLD